MCVLWSVKILGLHGPGNCKGSLLHDTFYNEWLWRCQNTSWNTYLCPWYTPALHKTEVRIPLVGLGDVALTELSHQLSAEGPGRTWSALETAWAADNSKSPASRNAYKSPASWQACCPKRRRMGKHMGWCGKTPKNNLMTLCDFLHLMTCQLLRTVLQNNRLTNICKLRKISVGLFYERPILLLPCI